MTISNKLNEYIYVPHRVILSVSGNWPEQFEITAEPDILSPVRNIGLGSEEGIRLVRSRWSLGKGFTLGSDKWRGSILDKSW